jgi:hypothetical protein
MIDAKPCKWNAVHSTIGEGGVAAAAAAGQEYGGRSTVPGGVDPKYGCVGRNVLSASNSRVERYVASAWVQAEALQLSGQGPELQEPFHSHQHMDLISRRRYC